jgi:hypothetical protein
MTYKQFIKDLFFGLVIGSVLIVGSLLLVRPFNYEITKENKMLSEKLLILERENSILKGENQTYKKWVDTMILSLTKEQRVEILKKNNII